MKNLIKKINTEAKTELKRSLNFEDKTEVSDFLNYAYYRGLFSKKELKAIENISFLQFKKSVYDKIKLNSIKRINEKVADVAEVENSLFKITEIKIVVEWSKSATWGANPNAEIWVYFINKAGHRDSEYFKSGSIGGCGYDKLSTAISKALNQSNVLKANLYNVANKAKNLKLSNHNIFGYGSGYGVLPSFEGGCGVSVYKDIFNTIGLDFKSVAGGKNFDVYIVSNIKK